MRLLLAMRQGALSVGEEGRATRGLGERELECAAVGGGRAFCGTHDAGLWRSEDDGDSWHRVGAETLADPVMSLAVDPRDPDRVWAGTEPSAVFRSDDGGDAWTELGGLTDLPSASTWSFPPRPHTHHVRWIEPDPAVPEHLYVGVEAGALVQTRDGGDTWTERPPGSRRDNHSMATHPDAPGRAYAAAGDGYAETRDGGETWTHPQEGLEHRYCWSVAVDPADPDTVFVSAARGARTAHTVGSAESYVYRRSGEEWTRLDGRGLPTGEGVTRAVLARGTDAGEVLAANDRGLYRTTDAGETWTPLLAEWPTGFESQTARGLAVVRD